ncbi:unnamed protein product [Angiostrongylus costaricensis]|uniref:Transposase n=1 Tax=Angiostrongylus costaricensis TaxID=334426 RepID=A0A0R3Q2V9_ANGCS|nr:unnamed protein product [Angiostrongylus costaricensis]
MVIDVVCYLSQKPCGVRKKTGMAYGIAVLRGTALPSNINMISTSTYCLFLSSDGHRCSVLPFLKQCGVGKKTGMAYGIAVLHGTA